MIGDAVTDLISAQQAKVAAIAAVWGTTDREALLAQAPDAVVCSPAEIPRLCADWPASAGVFDDVTAVASTRPESGHVLPVGY